MKNLFDEEVSTYGDEGNKKSRIGFIRMQNLFGFKEGFKCKNCKWFITKHYNNRNYFKCALWHISSSSATDIRANDTACGKYEVIKNEKTK